MQPFDMRISPSTRKGQLRLRIHQWKCPTTTAWGKLRPPSMNRTPSCGGRFTTPNDIKLLLVGGRRGLNRLDGGFLMMTPWS